MRGARIWRFGVVGTGAMSAAMMECMALEPRVTVAAVASSDAMRARGFADRFGITDSYSGLSELLARSDIDAVYIATSTRDHAAHSIDALAAGKAVLCEKPFATSAHQGQAVVAAAQRYRRLFVEAQWTCALPAYRELLRFAHERRLGEPVLLHAEFGISIDPASHTRLFEGEGAGVLLDFAVYPIALALQSMGAVNSVSAVIRRNSAGVDVHASLQLAHADGGHSQLAASLITTLPNQTTLSCTAGRVQLDSPVMGAESLRVLATFPTQGRGGDNGPGVKQRALEALRSRRWLRKLRGKISPGRVLEKSFGANRYSPQLTHFIDLLDRGALASDLMPHSTSIDVLRVVDAARLAQQTLAEPGS